MAASPLATNDHDLEAPRPGLLRSGAIVVVLVLADRLSLLLSASPDALPPLWPAIGVGVAVLAYYGLRRWPLVLIGSVVALLLNQGTHGFPQSMLLGTGMTIICFGQTMLAAWGLRRSLGERIGSRQTLNVLYFVVIAGLATALGGLATAAWLAVVSPDTLIRSHMFHWWLGHLLGILTVTPLLLIWVGKGRPRWSRRDWRDVLIFQILLGVVLIWTTGATQVDDPRVVYRIGLLALPALVISTLRFGLHCATVTLAITALVQIAAASQGRGWITLTTHDGSVASLQVLLITLDTIGLYVGGLANQYREVNEALVESHERYRALVDQAPVPILVHQNLRVVYANDAAARTLAAPSIDALIGMPAMDLVDPKWHDMAKTRIQAVYDGARLLDPAREQLLRVDGQVIEAEVATAATDFEGRPAAQVVFGDITERVLAEDALRASENRFATIFESNPSSVTLTTMDGIIIDVNRSFEVQTGYVREEIVGHSTVEIGLWAPPEQRQLMIEKLRESGSFRDMEVTLRARHGDLRHWLSSGAVIDLDGKPTILTVGVDMSQRLAAQEALRHSERQHRLLSELMADVAYQGHLNASNDLVIDWISGPVEPITGYTSQEFRGLIIDESFVFHEDYEIALAHLRTALAGQTDTAEYRFVRADGGTRWLRSYLQPVLDERGQVTGIIGASQDITRRRELEDQLVQAQKMEAVGRLAGGIAHDFNNLLTVINGYAELISAGLTPGEPLLVDMQEILHAGQRAAELTRQLLAFSRVEMRHVQTVGVNQVIKGMRRMLERLIREDIELALHLAPDLGMISADPTQLEQVIMNLVINAGDAISALEPPGGTLTISTENLDLAAPLSDFEIKVMPGRYVVMSVTDTGIGMANAVREHLFEPFFTTKEVGQGTGLGLATVYGIVRQNDGFVQVESNPGQGSTFRIGWPRAAGDEDLKDESTENGHHQRGQGIVLVVEDAAPVRKLASALLKQMGYQVLAASSGAEALHALGETDQPVDLLLTDLIMPDMGGRECAELACQLQPGLPVLFMSGYSYEALAPNIARGDEIRLLQKPFDRQQLAKAVQETLNS